MESGIPLAGYRLLLIVGHSEYWSLKARRHLEAFSRSGGHLGYATIGMYVSPQGGAVFNGAARDWTFGLTGDPIVLAARAILMGIARQIRARRFGRKEHGAQSDGGSEDERGDAGVRRHRGDRLRLRRSPSGS